MDIYDTAAVQKVWQRVGLTSPESDCAQLLALITRKSAAQQSYCALSSRGKTYQCLARQTARQIKKLQAIYFVLTGKTAPHPCPRREPVCFTPCFLRQLIENAQADARRLRELAQQFTAYRSPLLCMAQEDDRAAQVLLTCLAGRL